MKVREKKTETESFGLAFTYVQVRTLDDKEKLPDGAEKVPDDTMCHEWRREDF